MAVIARHEDKSTNAGRAILVAAVAAIGGFLFGFDSAVINGAVDPIKKDFHAGSFATGFAVAVALLGAALGAWFAGRLADRMGRIKVMVIAASIFALSSVLSAFSVSVYDLSVYRFIGGMAIGAASVIAPAYIAEIAPARMRGRLGSMQQLAIVLGIFAALLSDALLAHIAGGAGKTLWLGMQAWRWMFLVCLLPAGAYAVLALQIPESPRFLVARGRRDTARDVLTQMGSDSDPEGRIKEIEKTIRTEERQTLRDLRGGSLGLLPIVWIAILLSVFQQFVGINVIFYYSSTLWQSVGFKESDALTYGVITSLVNIATTFIGIALIDRIGRRLLLLIGSAGMVASLGTLAWAFSQATTNSDGDPSLSGAVGKTALVAANMFVVFFGFSWGPAVWVLLGEMFNNRIRAIGLSVAAAAQWLANFLVTVTFPPLSDLSLTVAYSLYTIMAALSFAFVLRYLKETSGRELEDMD